MRADRLRHLHLWLLLALVAKPLAAQVLEVGEGGSVRLAPGITGKQWNRMDPQLPGNPVMEAAPTGEPPPSDFRDLPSKTSKWAVQLGAYETLEQLEAGWRRIRERGADFLGRHMIVRIEALVDGKRYHRLSATGFPDLPAARGLCQQLRQRGLDCYVREGTSEQNLGRN